jgi:hypothetical protein
MMDDMHGWCGMGFGWINMILFWALVVGNRPPNTVLSLSS